MTMNNSTWLSSLRPEGQEPGAFEQLIETVEAVSCRFRNHNEDVYEGDEAPSRKEDEGAPIIHARKDGWCSFVDTEIEQPVEGLRQSCAKGT